MKKNKLKICFFIDNYFPNIDGVVMVVDNYAKRLSKFCDVTVVCPSYGKKDNNYQFPYEVIRVNSIRIPVVKQALALPKTDFKLITKLINKDFDIIHIHSPFTIGTLGVEVAKKANIPVIGTMHSQMKYEFYRYTKSHNITDMLTTIIMKTYDKCDECWAVNKKIAEIFIEYGYKGKPDVQENGTDLELIINEKESLKYINQKYGLKSNDLVLLFVGRITVVKNILFIIEVLNELKKKKQKFKMLFVGSGPDENILKEKISEYKLNDDVIICGMVKDRELLKKIYFRSKLFVFPSLFDASSLVQIEAASQKTPAIFIEESATSNTITPDQNGFVAPNDVGKFAEKIIFILNNNEYYDKVSSGAYNEVYKSWDKIAEDVHKRYKKLIKQKEEKNEKH